jgi:hypothetical protein
LLLYSFPLISTGLQRDEAKFGGIAPVISTQIEGKKLPKIAFDNIPIR